jgi:predicted MFS family arabinose efflux permease
MPRARGPDPPEREDSLEGQTLPGRWLVPVLASATFIAMLQAMALSPLLPVVSSDIGTSVSLLGQIPAITMLAAGLLGVVAGPLADRFGHHRALLVSLVAIVVSSIGMAVAPGYLLLLIAALVGSAGRAIVQPVAVVIVGDRYEGARQRRAVSWVMAGVTGAVIAGIPALTTSADLFGWRAALLGLAVVTAALIPLVWRGVGRVSPAPPTSARVISHRASIVAAYRPLLDHRPTLALVVSTLLGSAGIWAMATYLGAFYDERYGFTTQQIGWVYVVPGITLFAGSLVAGGRAGTLSLRPLLVLTRVVAGVAIAGVLMLPIPALVGVGLLAVQGLATGIANVFVVLLLLRESPAGRATTITLNTVGLSLGTALGSMLGGLVLAVTGFGAIGITALALSVLSGALVWTFPASPQRTATGVPSASRST